MRSRVVAGSLIVFAVLLGGTAKAQLYNANTPPPALTPPVPFQPSAATDTHWYGWQTLATDAAAGGMFVMALELDAAHGHNTAVGTLVALSAGAFLLGGPVVHAVHGNRTKVVRSLGPRVGLALAGGVVGSLLGEGSCNQAFDDEACPTLHFVYGMVVGGIAAAVLDAALTGYEPIPPSKPGVALVPLRDGAAVTFQGRF